MRVLIACEFSGVVREAFSRVGHDCWSCDFRPTEIPGNHFQCDVKEVLSSDLKWDLLIAHPDCRYLCCSGLHRNNNNPEREAETQKALEFVRFLLSQSIPKIALENPIGCISSQIRKPDQIIQPWQFGDDASKATCLWLKGLPCLVPTGEFPPRIVNGKKRWGNQTDSGQNRLGPSPTRAKERARTYQGIANAMAEQWG